MIELPPVIRLNAVDGGGRAGEAEFAAFGDRALEWAGTQSLLARQKVLAAPRPDLADWASKDVGWGIVLPHRSGIRGRDLAAATDAPEPVLRLLEARPGSPVLRYRRPSGGGDALPSKLLRYYADGTLQELTIGVGPFGTKDGQLPRYLLLVGGPDEIPWSVQFAANRRHFVGRLALDDDALGRYVDCLITGWPAPRSNRMRAVVWNTSGDAMTLAMEAALIAPLRDALDREPGLDVEWIPHACATAAALRESILRTRPALVVTSSHGRTGPLEDPAAMRARLGIPVDAAEADINIDAIAKDGALAGAIWLAYACCSAGSDAGSRFAGLLPAGSSAAQIVDAVGALGASIAPLPQRLLSADPPIAAFVGKVEPTFDWTLSERGTGENVVLELVEAVNPALYRPENVGLAFSDYYAGVGQLYGWTSDARIAMDALDPEAVRKFIYYTVTARDRESLVVLGDPTVMPIA